MFNLGPPLRAGGDPFWSNVILLLPGYGADGATNIVDESSFSNTISRNNASFSSITSKFGATSMLIDPADVANRITIADSSTWDFGSGDWTIEGWYYLTGSAVMYHFAMLWNGGATGTYLRLNSTEDIQYFHNGGGATSAVMPTATWAHIAACKVSGIIRFFLDGAVIATRTLASDVNMSGGFNVGNSTSFTTPWLGHIEQFRVTKGVGRYPGAFSVPTEPFPAG